MAWIRLEPLKCLAILLMACVQCGTCARGGVIYYPSTYKTPWTQAEADCQHIGGNLAKVTTAAENQEIVDFRQKWAPGSAQWIGGSASGVNDSWVWPDESAVGLDITTTNVDNGDIYLSLLSDYSWKDDVDSTLQYFVCEVTTGSAEADTAAERRSCWIANGLLVPPTDSENAACPRGKMYHVQESHLVALSWSDARAECQVADGHLAQITTEDENEIVLRIRLSHGMATDETWIDGKYETSWVWLDNGGATISWPTYGGPVPNAQGCLMIATDGLWKDASCGATKKFICERDISLLRSPTDVCFWVSTGATTWADAKTSCENVGGSLVTIHSAQEYRRFLDIRPNVWTWVGASDPDQVQRYRWTDGSYLTWTHWYPGQPDNNVEHCLASNSLFHTVSCTALYHYICEKTITKASFERTTRTVSTDSLLYACDSGYSFKDQTTNSEYTCSSATTFTDFNATLQHCQPSVIITESLYENYGSTTIPTLFDGDTATCLNLIDYWTYMTKTTLRGVRVGAGTFTVNVTVGADILTTALSTTKVYVADGLHSGDHTANYKTAKTHKKCTQNQNLDFSCECLHAACSVYVSFRMKGMYEIGETPYSVCEIDIP